MSPCEQLCALVLWLARAYLRLIALVLAVGVVMGVLNVITQPLAPAPAHHPVAVTRR